MALSLCSSSIISLWVHACGTDAAYNSSNEGVFGSLFDTPVINLPQTAVIGMHAIKVKSTERLSFVQLWSSR